MKQKQNKKPHYNFNNFCKIKTPTVLRYFSDYSVYRAGIPVGSIVDFHAYCGFL